MHSIIRSKSNWNLSARATEGRLLRRCRLCNINSEDFEDAMHIPEFKRDKMIFNRTRNKVISEKEIVCKSIFSQALGLMFHRKQNLIMIFKEERRISLHNFFVFFPIDVLVLDTEMKVVEIKRDFKPFRFWSSEKRGKYVIELGFPGEYEVGEKVEIR